jgi:hypothetical protein
MRDPQDRMARQRYAEATWVLIVASEYSVQAPGALAASGHPPRLTDGEPSTASSKLLLLHFRVRLHLAGLVKAA